MTSRSLSFRVLFNNFLAGLIAPVYLWMTLITVPKDPSPNSSPKWYRILMLQFVLSLTSPFTSLQLISDSYWLCSSGTSLISTSLISGFWILPLLLYSTSVLLRSGSFWFTWLRLGLDLACSINWGENCCFSWLASSLTWWEIWCFWMLASTLTLGQFYWFTWLAGSFACGAFSISMA